jgi:drug/metabolite transporter (DMT)-like permease
LANLPGLHMTSKQLPAAHQHQPGAAILALLAGSIVWGISWWPLKFFAAAGLDGHAIGLTAYTFVAVVALPIIWRQRSAWQTEWKLLLAIGFFFGYATLAFTAALMMGSVVRTMLLFYLLPAWGAIGGALILHERIGVLRLTAIVLSLAGVYIVMDGSTLLDAPVSLADILALTAGLSYAAAGIANRKATRIPLTSRTLTPFVGCMLVSWLALPVSQPAMSMLALSLSQVALLMLFAFVWLPAATLLTAYGTARVPASRASVLQVVELLVAVISAVWFGGEAFGVREAVGGVLILAACAIESVAELASERPASGQPV